MATTKRRQIVRTPEQRTKFNQYQQQYRQRNPDRVARWRRDYIIRKAARLLAEQTDSGDGGNDGGN